MILLVDPSDMSVGGHHRLYRDALLQIDGTKFFDRREDLPDLKADPLGAIRSRRRYVDAMPQSDACCLLYFDGLCHFPGAIRKARAKAEILVGVQHWFPTEKIRQRLFVQSARQLDALVVHSEFTQRQCESAGLDNVVTIDYPCFCSVDYDSLPGKSESDAGKKVFTCLGGSRPDKGLDVLAASFEFLPVDVVNRVKFVIAGKEGVYPYAEVARLAESRGVIVEFDNRILPDETYWMRIKQTDVILLPYKRAFSGNSGPMTDGVWANKYILGPSWGNLGYLIEKNHLGSTFAIENPKALAAEIARVSRAGTTCDHEYRRRLDPAVFVKSYKILFEELMS